MIYNLFFIPTLVILFLANPIENSKPKYINVKIGENNYKADYANTLYKKSKGYMFTNFDKKEAMLFYYKNPTKPTFYNKNVSFPLRVYWVNDNKEIIQSSVFEKDSFTIHAPREKINYVIEIPLKKDYSNDLGDITGESVEIGL